MTLKVAALLAAAILLACTRTPALGSPRANLACPDSGSVPEGKPQGILLLDGKRVPEEHMVSMHPDSVFGMFILDSAGLAARGLCPGTIALSLTTMAEARRLGLQPPPPPLCLRNIESALPVGQRVRMSAGLLDILDECDRAPPGGLTWASADTAVLVVDSAGEISGIRPGVADVIVRADTVEVRQSILVVPAIARIEVTADSVVATGDTVTVSALAYGADGRALPGVRLQMSAFTEVDDAGPRRHARWWSARLVSTENSIRVSPRRTGAAWVRAGVIGMADSVSVRVVDK